MAIPSMFKFAAWSILVATVGSAQSSDRRPNDGFAFPEAPTNTQDCRTRNGSSGSCIELSECKHGIDYQRGIVPELCYWIGSRPVVCCLLISKTDTSAKVVEGPVTSSQTSCGSRTTPKESSRIPQVAGGWISLPSAWPWMTAILRSNLGIESFLCGGTMVSTKYILTAGHCFGRNGIDRNRIPIARFVIRVGSNINAEGSAHRLKRIVVHQDYRVGVHYNDIALIEVNQAITLSSAVQPICLPSSELRAEQLVGREVIVIGWGDQSFGGLRDSKLREVNVSVIDREVCNTAYSTLSSRSISRGVTSQFICAGDLRGGKDACQADSGGPLMLPSTSSWTIVGVVSFGYGCAQKGFPGVYTQVTSYLNWIKDNSDL